MPISVTCQECFTSVRVKEQALGKKFRCKVCGAVVVVRPDEEPEDFAAPAPVQTLPRKSAGKKQSAGKKSSAGKKAKKPGGRRSKRGHSKLSEWAATFDERFSDDPTWKVACYALLGIALTIGLPFAVRHITHEISSARASSGWPTASATIVETSISTSTRKGRRRYQPRLAYTFEVNQQTYRGTRLSFDGYSSSSEADVQDVLNHYARGSAHQIHYDPTDPENCVIVPGAGMATWASLIVPAICLMGPFLAFMQGLVVLHRVGVV